ncbi:MAG TPA: SDR family NAD(P)-dependent oxidoreductase [Nocardioidaceae bacterium]|nr:SDR family NAD(P)-dependent oxidoreductase [Nocardioidaceae bacterium]
MSRPVVLVVGAGPGVGRAVARRFGRAGYDVAMVARSPERLDQLGEELEAEGITAGWAPADITDDRACRAAISRLGDHVGRIDVLHFNPSAFRAADPLTLTPQELLDDLRLGVASLLTAVQGARPYLRAGGRILATGSMAADEPSARAASLGVQKAALRNLVQSLDATLAPDGIRAMTLTVRGVLAPDTAFSPARVADALFDAAQTPDTDWRSEVPYEG